MARQTHLARLKARGDASRNRFADALADGADVKSASASAGVCLSRGKLFLKEIRQRMGWQAV